MHYADPLNGVNFPTPVAKGPAGPIEAVPAFFGIADFSGRILTAHGGVRLAL